MEQVDVDAVATVARWVRDAGRVVALTGAGVSTGSGIPDFRGPQGVWTRDPEAERLSTIQAYLGDPDVRRKVWRQRLEHPAFRAEPGPAHLGLAALERAGHLDTLITQNVDGLHQAAGSSPGRVVEVHGTVHEVECLSCERRRPAPVELERVREGDPDPRCLDCGGLQKSATISFGQPLDPAVLDRAAEAAGDADLLLALGSTLVVHPVALLPRATLDAGGRLVVVNAEPTPYDDVADMVLRSEVGATLTALADSVEARRP